MFARVAIERIFDNPFQMRTVYTDVEELGESILKMRAARPETGGLIQVPPARILMGEPGRGEAGWKVLNPEEYGGVESCLEDEPLAFVQLAAGHRRFRAFAGLAASQEEYQTFPVDVLMLDNQQMADMAWEENAKRKDLTAIEEAEALAKAIELFNYTQAQIGERWGLSQSAVANKLRLLQLPRDAQEAIRQGQLTEKHGRVLLSAYQKSPAIYEAAAAAILPAPIGEAAQEVAGRMVADESLHWYQTVRAPEGISKVECAACMRTVFQPGQGISERYRRANDSEKGGNKPFWALCEPCYRAARGWWSVPSTAEAAGIVQQAINQNSTQMVKVAWPLDKVFEAPVNGKVWRKLPACEGCPTREMRDKEPFCLDKGCFERKREMWLEETFAAVRVRLEADWGEAGKSVEIVTDWSGMTLSTHGVDQDLIKNGICIPGKCKRLRLKYSEHKSEHDLCPYDDLPFWWNCNNRNSHDACQRRYLASQVPEEKKTKERRAAELASQRKADAKLLAVQAAEAVRTALEARNLEVWRGIVEKVAGYGKGKELATVELCQEKVAQQLLSDIFGQLGYRDWTTDYAMASFQQSLSKEMSKYGVNLPLDTSEIGRKLERIYEFVSSGRVKGSLTPEQVEGNWVNLEKLAEELKGLKIDSEARMRLFNQFMEVSDELWEAAAEVGLEWPQDKAIISQEMVEAE